MSFPMFLGSGIPKITLLSWSGIPRWRKIQDGRENDVMTSIYHFMHISEVYFRLLCVFFMFWWPKMAAKVAFRNHFVHTGWPRKPENQIPWHFHDFSLTFQAISTVYANFFFAKKNGLWQKSIRIMNLSRQIILPIFMKFYDISMTILLIFRIPRHFEVFQTRGHPVTKVVFFFFCLFLFCGG